MKRNRAKNFAAVGYRWGWTAVLGLGWALAGLAQSTDPGAPTLLPANPFNGTIRARDNASYYYVCTAGPGAITVSLPVKTTGNLSQLDLEIYDASNSIIAKIDATSSGSPQEAKFTLSSQQRLLIKLSGFRSNDSGSFTLRLKGQVSLAGGLAAPPANHEPANRTSQPPAAAKDTLPPTIRLLEPSLSRGQGSKTSGSKITVRGEATDASGVSEVQVRGIVARLDGNGNFSAEVLLKVGENQIEVAAVDVYGNRATEVFTVSRAADAPPPSGAPPAALAKARYYALLIGVERYTSSRQFAPLANPLRDAKKLQEVLLTFYTFERADVQLLANPTRDDILTAFEQLEKTLKPEDNLLIFYAGHGYWDANREQGYWLPVDATDASRSKWLSNADVRDAIRGIKARHTLLITDACFGGGILNSRSGALPPSIEELMRLPSRNAMTSGALTTVPDRSVFLEYLTKRLQENRSPYKTAAEIFSSLQTAVTDNSPPSESGRPNVPQYGTIQAAGHEGGDFIFIRRQ